VQPRFPLGVCRWLRIVRGGIHSKPPLAGSAIALALRRPQFHSVGKPAFVRASASFSRGTSALCLTVTFCDARSTDASSTPGILRRAALAAFTHPWHVIWLAWRMVTLRPMEWLLAAGCFWAENYEHFRGLAPFGRRNANALLYGAAVAARAGGTSARSNGVLGAARWSALPSQFYASTS